MKLIQSLFASQKLSLVWVIFLLTLGVSFRLIYPGSYGFSFDQVQIISQANKILQGDFTLIGPRTGPANMFTGPLVYYLTAGFIYFFGDLKAVYLTVGFISLLTGFGLYFLAKTFTSELEAKLTLLVWAVSPYLVGLDRTLWNPILTVLAAALLFYPLLKNHQSKLSVGLLFLGSFLAYQAHFTGFIAIMLVAFSIAYLRLSAKNFLALIAGVGLSLIPTMIFDLRNNFLNLNGLINFIQTKNNFSFGSFLADISHNFYIILETLGKIILYPNTTLTMIVLGVIILGLNLRQVKQRKFIGLSLAWLIVISLSFGFYKDNKPEYYFSIALPALIYLLVNLLKSLQFSYLLLILTFFSLNSIITNLSLYKNSTGLVIKNLADIQAYLATQNVKKVVFDVPYGADTGLKYLFENIKTNNSGQIFHITYPNDYHFSGIKTFADVAVWADNRVNEAENYLTTHDYILSVNSNYYLLRNDSPQPALQNATFYQIVRANQLVGDLLIAKENKDQLNWVIDCQNLKEARNFNWQQISEESYLRYANTFCLKLTIAPTDFNQLNLNLF